MNKSISLVMISSFLFMNLSIAQQCPKPSGLSASSITENGATLNWLGTDEHVSYELTVKHGPKNSSIQL